MKNNQRLLLSDSSSQNCFGAGACPRLIADVNSEMLGNGEKSYYYTVKARVTVIKHDRALYMGCPSAHCNKKVMFAIILFPFHSNSFLTEQVVDQNNGLYCCGKCQHRRKIPGTWLL